MKTEVSRIKNILIQNGVRNLHEFGYPLATKENTLTDILYKEFFKSMLKDNLGQDETVDTSINELLDSL